MKYSNIKRRKNAFRGSRVVLCGRTDGQTDMTKLKVALLNVRNARAHKTHTYTADEY